MSNIKSEIRTTKKKPIIASARSTVTRTDVFGVCLLALVGYGVWQIRPHSTAKWASQPAVIHDGGIAVTESGNPIFISFSDGTTEPVPCTEIGLLRIAKSLEAHGNVRPITTSTKSTSPSSSTTSALRASPQTGGSK